MGDDDAVQHGDDDAVQHGDDDDDCIPFRRHSGLCVCGGVVDSGCPC